uniref:Uncharacterized protein n=1 Tax=Meloidogyne enterolobii TaxID=390850 RepID=A0A6V7Y5C9_MELEN|nr:unnamed protein product [Meloidogyne enterolobii]
MEIYDLIKDKEWTTFVKPGKPRNRQPTMPKPLKVVCHPNKVEVTEIEVRT